MADEQERSESGSPIYRHKEREKEVAPAFGDEDNIEKISEHIERYVGEPKNVFHELISDLVHIDVHIVEPSDTRPYYTLVTSGMSDRPMTVPEGADEYRYAELLACLPPTWKMSQEDFKDDRNYWPVRWLKMLARMPHAYDTWLGMGHTVPNGDPAEPYAAGTKLCCMMLLPPPLFDEEFMTLGLPDRVINFYQMVPIYRQEMELKLKEGLEGFIEKLEQDPDVTPDDLAIINPTRKNLVGTRKRFWLF